MTHNEELQISVLGQEWYEHANGYDPSFLGDRHHVAPPAFKDDIQGDIAPLLSGGYVLDYTHFSIVMSKSRRLAYYTAVNIDGEQQKEIRRTKDNWYFDSRMARDYQAGPELYANNDLDRGHLVRRRDPVWGENAEKANEDTFHFTNCAPQHKNLNQKTWLELEDYILHNAVTRQLKVTVFTGAVFKESDPLYRGIKIPEDFWKVVVMVKQDGTLSATAYLQTQKEFLGKLDFTYGEYKTYQVSVSHIETLTGLHFGELRSSDPLNDSGSPKMVEARSDILL